MIHVKIELARRTIEFEIEDLHTRPDPEPLLVEMLHEAAFHGGSLANPKICPPENINKIQSDDLYSFMRNLYLPKRTVLTCIGTDHKEFVQMTKEKFSSVEPLWEENPSILKEKNQKLIDIENNRSKWTGGSKLIEKDLSDLNQGSNNQLPELTHLVVGLESPSFLDEKDFVKRFCMKFDELELMMNPTIIKQRKIPDHNYSRAWVPVEAPPGTVDKMPVVTEAPPNPDRKSW